MSGNAECYLPKKQINTPPQQQRQVKGTESGVGIMVDRVDRKGLLEEVSFVQRLE